MGAKRGLKVSGPCRRRARRVEGLCDLLALAPDGRTAVAGKAGRRDGDPGKG